MQKSIIVDTDRGNAILNQYLEDGWKVHSMCPMPSSCSAALALTGEYSRSDKIELKCPSTCLVILEK